MSAVYVWKTYRTGNVEWWYDKHARSWVIRVVDADGNPVGESDYMGTTGDRDSVIVSRLKEGPPVRIASVASILPGMTIEWTQVLCRHRGTVQKHRRQIASRAGMNLEDTAGDWFHWHDIRDKHPTIVS